MNTYISKAATVLTASLCLAACATPLTRQDVGTVTGAVVGGVAGAALTGGSTVGTVGGAAAGGYIGNRIGKDLERRRY